MNSFNKRKKLKICLISFFGHSLYNKKSNVPFGGGEAQLFLLSKKLAKFNDLNIHVIMGDYITKRRKEYYENIKLHISIPLKLSLKNSILRYFNLFFTLWEIKPDIVIQRMSGINTGICALFCKLFRKRFIYSIAHDMDVNGEAEQGFIGKFFKYGLSNASVIIAQNEDQVLKLEKRKKKHFNNLKIIKSGYEIKPFKEKKIGQYILWVGKSISWKRPEIFLKLALEFPQEKFIMINNKTDDDKLLKSIITKKSEISNLTYLEFVPFDKIDDYFKNAKIFINTSTYEGFPNTFIQSLKNKTPVISLSVDPDDILVKNKCGFNCNNSNEKMIYNLRNLLENQNLYKEYSENAYLCAIENFDINKTHKMWLRLIRFLKFNRF